MRAGIEMPPNSSFGGQRGVSSGKDELNCQGMSP